MVLVKRAAINRGLQGTTIAPKKKPYVRELTQGLLVMGARPFGRNLPISTLKINSKLIMNSMPKATGDTIAMTLVSDTSRTVVNISPSNIINRITPEVITKPNRKMVFLLASFPDS